MIKAKLDVVSVAEREDSLRQHGGCKFGGQGIFGAFGGGNKIVLRSRFHEKYKHIR